eukprot:1159547-Pelagomonas_calceolata.AAC.16
MRGGMTYVNSVIFDMVPVFHRRIDTALANLGQPRLPLRHTLFKFGSWMGGRSRINSAQCTASMCVYICWRGLWDYLVGG